MYGEAKRIEAEIQQVLESAPKYRQEVQASLGRYICVLSSGYLEVSLQDCIRSYVTKRADGSVARFATSFIKRTRNPNQDQILQMVGRFGPSFKSRLEKTIDDVQKDAITSVVANRNLIVHGRLSSISFAQSRAYYQILGVFIRNLRFVFESPDDTSKHRRI